MPPLSTDRAVALLKQISGWTMDGEQIYKEYQFKNFVETVAFVNKVAVLSEREGHHPDLALHDYKFLRITLTTHAAHGLTENDFILAAKIDESVEDLHWDQKGRARAKTFDRQKALTHQQVWKHKGARAHNFKG